MKRCPDCGGVKPVESFGFDRSRFDGRQVYCLECKRVRSRIMSAKRRGAIRQWERDRAGICIGCGGSLEYRAIQRRCAACLLDKRHTDAEERTARLLDLRRAGWSNKQIATSEGCTAHAVASLLQRSAVARFPGLEWLPAPYAAARGVA